MLMGSQLEPPGRLLGALRLEPPASLLSSAVRISVCGFDSEASCHVGSTQFWTIIGSGSEDHSGTFRSQVDRC